MKHKMNSNYKRTIVDIKNTASPYHEFVGVVRIYQNKSGEYLPDCQQPNFICCDAKSVHQSTRYKNVDVSVDVSIKENSAIIDKSLPELYHSREMCCGCGACYSICPVREMLPNFGEGSTGRYGEKYALPHGAIYLEADEEGFDYPVVDASLCIRCYKCLKVCPLKEQNE